MELSLRQDLNEVLDAEHLSEDRIGEDRRIDRILRAMRGSGAHLVTDELGDVDGRVHTSGDLIPRRERSGQERLGGRAAAWGEDRTGRRERQGGDVIHGDHMGVAGTAGGDALLSDELPRA